MPSQFSISGRLHFFNENITAGYLSSVIYFNICNIRFRLRPLFLYLLVGGRQCDGVPGEGTFQETRVLARIEDGQVKMCVLPARAWQ